MIKNILLSILTIIIILLAAVFFMAQPWEPSEKGYFNTKSASGIMNGDTLRIISWNIAYGYGQGSDGDGYKTKLNAEIYERIKTIGRFIQDFKIDIALLQEVDFYAKRSGYKNQIEELSAVSGLGNYAYSVTWNANYVPFPYFPISDHFGRVKSGGGILSRFKIADYNSQLLPKPDSNPWWYNWFYLYRFQSVISIDKVGEPFKLANMHLEAFDITNREEHANLLKEWITEQGSVSIFGGDMNSIPPNSIKKTGFSDNDDNYEDDNTQEIIRSIESFFEPVFSDSLSQQGTYPALNPNRQLDYLFAKEGLQIIDYRVMHEAGDVSDHLPVLLICVVND